MPVTGEGKSKPAAGEYSQRLQPGRTVSACSRRRQLAPAAGEERASLTKDRACAVCLRLPQGGQYPPRSANEKDLVPLLSLGATHEHKT